MGDGDGVGVCRRYECLLGILVKVRKWLIGTKPCIPWTLSTGREGTVGRIFLPRRRKAFLSDVNT